ncbi:MAG: class I SAM-dependent rRNA methyltransferase [Acidobacteria bacterium]|nr:class I SAM-dependent rRNA methyltransferase [Acidobacteriota bacterium]
MTSLPSVRVSRKGADRVASGHPWIFSSDVTDRGAAQPGDAVRVMDPRGRALGTAHFSSTSQISLRLLSDRADEIGTEFFRRRLSEAARLRERLVENTDAFRLVHGEADRLPALVVDRYGDCLVVQTLSQGMDRCKPVIVEALTGLFSPRAIVARNDAGVRDRESLPREVGVLAGEDPGRLTVTMNGLRFHVEPLRGQKTGIFLDQRENYRAAARYAHGEALDCFCSSGGFALHLAARCAHVEAVDSAAEMLALAGENLRANGIQNVTFKEANAFDLLAGYALAGRRLDTVVLDPPAFAKSRSTLDAAARGYKEINLRALKLLGSGGVLVTCSCSHHMSEAALLEVVAEASLDARRTLRVIERRTQARDHPILLTVPETHYLKCLVLEVV